MKKGIIFKIYRILKYRHKVFGEIGKHNKFNTAAYVHSDAQIGNYNYIGPYAMINNAIIGNYCSIAPSVKIGQGEHSIQYITTFNIISKKLINFNLHHSPSIIGNDVWIGANAVVLQGVKIGHGAVIGANAVVTKDIPDFAIAVGVPAKIKKYRFSPEKIKLISDTQWWDYDIENAEEIIKNINIDEEQCGIYE